ncbi:MAG: hypothetical protein VXW58_09500, partial [Pseudomonadota bacterium]|nr:hypothetical protein [Pseudomonadota bacterium]
MSFLRPEAKAALWRAREVLAGLAIGLVGLSTEVVRAGRPHHRGRSGWPALSPRSIGLAGLITEVD